MLKWPYNCGSIWKMRVWSFPCQKTTKEKCKHIFISTDFELTQKLSQDVRCCVHNCSLVLAVCMFVCLVFFFFLQFVSIAMYPGNKLRGNRDCAIIIRRGGGGVWDGKGAVSKLFRETCISVWLVQVCVNQEEIKMCPAKTTGRPPSVPEVPKIFIQIWT